ncbi:MAG: RNA-guided endonuclease InsQ/TnpB family protein [Xenococcaceae cyanobacterium]
MLLTYQYRLQPTTEQAQALSHCSELLRRHWNYALGQRLDYLRRTRSSIDRCSLISEPIGDIPNKVDYYSQAADLKETKRLFPEYKDIYADCQQQNLMRLDKAWKRWLIPGKNGKRAGRPRFKKQGDICSITFPRVNSAKAGANLFGCTLKLSKIGEIPVVLHRPIPEGSAIKTATIVFKADGWYVSFALEDNTVPVSLPVDEIKTSIGIDVGLEKFLTTSDAESIAVPQFYRKAQAVLARIQRKLARMELGSINYGNQKSKIARLHLHIARQRKDFHYAVAHYLCANYDLIGFEKLNIKSLARTRLAKSILDVAWRTFLNILQAVAVRRGKHTREVDARGTSIECFNCEERVVKDLSVRVHDCPRCGVSLDRDYNASINVLKRTIGLSFATCGGLGVAQPMKQEISFVNLRSSR